MTNTTADRSEVNVTIQKSLAGLEQRPPAGHSIDRFAAARMDKKKQKRAKHRAKLKRSHTDG
ncbi:MAG TPA: hypothetical protein VG649_01425 [Candidatus Angelobacter sp.]|jgi:hypothetical protein|nr:hypothetical protein [Candidatus Angelobacter sp.]